MAVIHISDELDEELQQKADQLHRTKEEFVHETLSALLEEDFLVPTDLTPDQIARMTESVAQLDRGEAVSGDQFMAKLDAFIADLESR